MSELPLFSPIKSIEITFKPDAEIVLFSGDVGEFVTQIPDNSIALIVTSPPYNLGKEYEDRVSIEKYLKTQAQLIAQLHRILRNDGSLCWQVGNFVENGEIVTLHDVAYWFMEWQQQKDDKILRKFIKPMETALALVPKIYIRDSAVDAVCHGANLTAPGVLSLETGIKDGSMVAVLSLKGEAVALAKATASTEEILNMEHGIVAETKRVLMPRGTYPKCWKSGEI